MRKPANVNRFLPTIPRSTLATIYEEIDDEECSFQIISDEQEQTYAQTLQSIIYEDRNMGLNTDQNILERYTCLRMHIAQLVRERNRSLQVRLEQTESIEEEPVPMIVDENDNVGGDQEVAITSYPRQTTEDDGAFCAFFVVDLPTLLLQDSGISGDECAEVITDAGKPCTDSTEVNELTPFVERSGEYQGDANSRGPESITEVEVLLIDFSEFTGTHALNPSKNQSR